GSPVACSLVGSVPVFAPASSVPNTIVYRSVFFDGITPGAAGKVVRVFQNPCDPSPSSVTDYSCSYVSNAWVFSVPRTLPAGVPDGLSNTIFFSEHYRLCRRLEFSLFMNSLQYRPDITSGGSTTAPTFADAGYDPHNAGDPDIGDYYPITVGTPPRSAATDGVTFQSRPSLAECDPRQPNAASSRGLQALMGDGSVRTIRAGVSPFVFWAAVTPAGGEVESADF
ncbi:MAG: DUF1559 domain-containing protein, partial [Gemmataceae bacterium]|nr:DUF1559 domain-containing protein [Gemmataceae bacterium]